MLDTAKSAPLPPIPASARYVRRLGPHHFAYLRAACEGLDTIDCARRYLGIEHGHQATTAHRETVEAVRAVARRRGDSAWRLVGIRLQGDPDAGGRPTLDDFAVQLGLDGFSQAEVLALYEEAWPADRRAGRGQRLRHRQRELLRCL